MALNNFYTIVNNSGITLKTIIDGKPFSIIDKQQVTENLFKSGENINVLINGRSINLFLPQGKNSWSTIVYNKEGVIQIFPSSPCQQKLSY